MTDRPDLARLQTFVANPRRAVWTIAGPMIGGMMLHVLYNVADTAYVGRLGPSALAGLTIVFPAFFVLIALANGIGSGITVVVAQAIGRGDRRAAEQAGGTAIALALSVGAVFAAVGLLAGPLLLQKMGASGQVLDAAWQYFSILALMAPLPLCNALLRALLTGQGDARRPMMVMGIATVINIALDPLLIFVAGWGIRGAAIATAIAQFCSLALLLRMVLRSPKVVIRLRAEHVRPRLEPLRQVLAIGVPASLGQLLMALGAMAMNRVVASFGATALAGYGAANRVDAIVALPILGLAAGAATVMAMFAGAGRADLVRSTTLYVLRWAISLAATVGVLAYVGSGAVLRVFTTDAAVAAVGHEYLSYMLFVYPMMGAGMVGSRLLLGLGFPNLSLLLTAIRLLIVAVPMAYIAVYLFGGPLQRVWLAILLGSASATLATSALVYSFVWRRDPTVRATRDAPAPL